MIFVRHAAGMHPSISIIPLVARSLKTSSDAAGVVSSVEKGITLDTAFSLRFSIVGGPGAKSRLESACAPLSLRSGHSRAAPGPVYVKADFRERHSALAIGSPARTYRCALPRLASMHRVNGPRCRAAPWPFSVAQYNAQFATRLVMKGNLKSVLSYCGMQQTQQSRHACASYLPSNKHVGRHMYASGCPPLAPAMGGYNVAGRLEKGLGVSPVGAHNSIR